MATTSNKAREVKYDVGYAKTSRSSCSISKKTISQGTLRIGRSTPSPFHDGYVTKYSLVNYFFKKYGKDVDSPLQFKGFDELKIKDQRRLQTLMGIEVDSTSDEAKLKEAQSESLWEIKNYLSNNLTPKDLQLELELNGVRSGGGKDDLVNRLADGWLHGKATCASCSTPDKCQLKYESGLYRCRTDLEWGRCPYEGLEVVIHKWKKSSKLLSSHPTLKSLDKPPLNRVMDKIVKKNVEEYDRDAKYPLRGMKFTSFGRLTSFTKSEFSAFIKRFGGTWVENISPDVDYVVSTFNVMLKDSKTIDRIHSLGLAVVTELLVKRLTHEFGFDQSVYLLDGILPPIAHARLKGSGDKKSKPIDVDPPREVSTTAYNTKSIEGGFSPHELGKVAKECTYSHGGKIYENHSVMLLMTDLQTTVNKFYQLQLVDVNGEGKRFSLFRKWGRVGTTSGGFTQSHMKGLEATKLEFYYFFTDKSGLKWEERDSGLKKPGKYYPLAFDKNVDAKDEEEDGYQSKALSLLDPHIRTVVDLIFDTEMMKREMTNLEIDIRKMPLGKISTARIKDGYQVLKDIEKLLSISDRRSDVDLISLSNKFYTMIPTDFGDKAAPVIRNTEMLGKKMKQLEALMDIEVASGLMNTTFSSLSLHPSDENYKKLGTRLKHLSTYSREFNLIKRYIKNGYDPTQLGYEIELMNLFQIEAEDSDDWKEMKNIRPRKLLWHGSRLCNYVGILHQGLRIAPPEAPTTGYLWGKGLYFADRIQKSAPFCCATKENPIGLLILSDVVVGEPYKVKKPEYVEKLPEGKHSTYVYARTIPDPSKDEKMGVDKTVLPLGEGIPSNAEDVYLEDSEYVVYRQQQSMKYLVVVKFLFK